MTPEMVERGKSIHPGLRLLNGTVEDLDATGFDWVVASGIFCLNRVKPETEMLRTVREMAKRARKGVAFNSLSLWAPDPENTEFHADPLRTLELCRDLTSRVSLRHDYHPRDFTVYLYLNR